MPEPKKLDEETLALLKRALDEDDPAVRVAAADSIRLAGIRDDRFLEPLLAAIGDENTVVSDAASLAAVDLGFERAGPLILRRLEKALAGSEKGQRRRPGGMRVAAGPNGRNGVFGASSTARATTEVAGWSPWGCCVISPPWMSCGRWPHRTNRSRRMAPYLQFFSGGENQSGSAARIWPR